MKKWAAFFAQHQFLIGALSIDGPQVVSRSNYRKRRQGGRLSRVVNAIRLLRANDVEFNTLTVVDDASCRHGNTIYHF